MVGVAGSSPVTPTIKTIIISILHHFILTLIFDSENPYHQAVQVLASDPSKLPMTKQGLYSVFYWTC